ncbi:hypothetical protein [Actinoplanes sichuanensis]|uniref:Uncharacterized protein n=1 Tax=Actinoplanes sichuanensis TaxID=512349 RepID=A0ABW4ATQ7_9ACTN|nr:hypothetical protein [Actinoplanes sichuanensis]
MGALAGVAAVVLTIIGFPKDSPPAGAIQSGNDNVSIQGGNNNCIQCAVDRDPSSPAPPQPPPAYGAYDRIKDLTGTITVDVPAEWNSRRSNGWHASMSPYHRDVNVGPGLNAAVNVDDWIDGIMPVPGVFIGTSERMIRDGITLDRLASVFSPSGCRSGPARPYRIARLGLDGLLREWTCNGGHQWIDIALEQPDRHYLMNLQATIVSDRDRAAFERIAQSLDIRHR